MATFTTNSVCDNSTLTNFKQWAQTISTAFSTLGWVQTADTGQVNWSTISAVPTNAYVYEIWKANDTLASTLPIYVKVEYGSSTTVVALRFTVGTSSNGSGTITGTTMTQTPWVSVPSLANQGTTAFPCYFSGTAGEFRMYLWQSLSASIGAFFMIERSKDASGNNTAEYFTAIESNCANQTSGTPPRQQTVLASGLVSNMENGAISIGLTVGSGTGQFNGSVAAFPVFPVVGKLGNPMLGLMSAVATDVSDGATVTVTSMYGTTHTFIAMTKGVMTNGFAGRNSYGINMGGLMRYE